MKPNTKLLAAAAAAALTVWPMAALPGPTATRPTAYKSSPGPHRVAVTTRDWKDARRGRLVPVKIYSPADAQGALPAIVFSHGLGGSRDGYEYLGRHWAGHGYVCVHLQHLGSDAGVWRGARDAMGAMRKAAADLRNAVDRPRDVRFAIDQLARAGRDGPLLTGRVDLGRVGVAGHSFGAYTALASAGQAFGRRGLTLADGRIKAAIPMSAPVPRRGDLGRAFGGIRIPCLHMTGTRDRSIIGDTTPAQRRLPFDHSRACERYLVTFTGGDHMVFAGTRRRGDGGRDARFQDLIRQSTTAFWDAFLKGDAKAKAWLDGRFGAVLGGDGAFEHRRPSSRPHQQ